MGRCCFRKSKCHSSDYRCLCQFLSRLFITSVLISSAQVSKDQTACMQRQSVTDWLMALTPESFQCMTQNIDTTAGRLIFWKSICKFRIDQCDCRIKIVIVNWTLFALGMIRQNRYTSYFTSCTGRCRHCNNR